jgi:ATP-dependent Clp protease ATP-binding subunit ClpA
MRRASCFSAPHRRPSTAYEESRDLESSYVGPEHVLLALARDTETAAGDLLERFGVSHTKLLGAVIRGVEVGGAPRETSKTPKLDEFGDLTAEAREGFDPEFGARPLRRTIQRRVENELSWMVLKDPVQPGDRVVVAVADDDLHFEVESGAAQELVEEEAEQPAGAPA